MTPPADLPLAQRVDPGHTALIVVDVQNDFCHVDGALAQMGADVSAAQEMLPRLMLLVEAAREAGALVVWLKLANTAYTNSDVAHEQRLRTRPGTDVICQVGTWGAELYRVEPLDGEPVVEKRRYSPFVGSDFELILRSQGIRTVVVTGVATNVCVESTARDAYMRDFYVALVDDCCAAYDPAKHATTLATVGGHFGIVVQSAELMEVWRQADSREGGALLEERA